MKNLIIGLAVILVVIAGLWYFGMRPQQQMTGMDEMVECPVMGTKIKKSDAYSSTKYKGQTYYFCCAACPDEFKKNPEKYVK